MPGSLEVARDHLRFVSAREFWRVDGSEGSCSRNKNWIERAGDILLAPYTSSTDRVLRDIDKPYMVTALTLAALGIATLVYYPEQTAELALKVAPLKDYVMPWMVKFGVYIATESVILGVGLRTLGRQSDRELVSDWRGGRVVAIPLGSDGISLGRPS